MSYCYIFILSCFKIIYLVVIKIIIGGLQLQKSDYKFQVAKVSHFAIPHNVIYFQKVFRLALEDLQALRLT